MTNINQMIENTKHMYNLLLIMNMKQKECKDQNAEAKKAIFIRNMMRKKLTAYLKLDEVEEMKD